MIGFGEPIFPVLEHVGQVERGTDDAAHHLVIEGENYHALKMLVSAYEGQVDCIYIDPPYNSGATDWKYNNDYVDGDDAYRHSKWLSMMEKRLKLSRRLLKPDGVMIVAIDENEVHHLSLLLEQCFPECNKQLITTVINPKGIQYANLFSKVNENVIYTMFGKASICKVDGNYLSETSKEKVRWASLLRSGNNSSPSDRPNLVYPIAVDPRTSTIAGVGPTLLDRIDARQVPFERTDTTNLKAWEPPVEQINGCPVVWPRRNDGRLGRWAISASTILEELLPNGYIRANSYKDTWTFSYLLKGTIKNIAQGRILVTTGSDGSVSVEPSLNHGHATPKTVWNHARHDAGLHGTHLLSELLGDRRRFPFPKSIYSTRDALDTIVRDNPSALIVDFFAGSGTTLHAVLLLNEADGGNRRCVLVTNNEIGPDNEKKLTGDGIDPNSYEWRKLGIFEHVTRPRVEAAIKGERADGTELSGTYAHAGDKPMKDGFEASADFMRLRYLDPDALILEDCFDVLHPLLWVASGSTGSCPTSKVGGPISEHEPGYLLPDGTVIPSGCGYAVLLRESRFRRFSEELKKLDTDVTHVWLQARTHESYTEMRSELGARFEVGWLFQDAYKQFRQLSGGAE